MNATWLQIIPSEPLLLGDVKIGTNFLSSLSYIPGRLLRGTWAEWMIAQGKEKEILATVAEVRIGNFFPTVEWRTIRYVSPSLLSMLTCKRKEGFKDEPHRERQGHGVLDTLLPHLAYHLLLESGARFLSPFALNCWTCDDRMEPLRGIFTAYQDGSSLRYVKTRIRYHAQTKTALSRQRGVAYERMLYVATALSPLSGQPDTRHGSSRLAFIGRVYGDPEKVKELCEALNAIPIGSLHTRGYGKVEVKEVEVQGLPSLAERVKAFNQRLGEIWQDLKRLAINSTDLPDSPLGIYFSVDLLAPGLFRAQGLPSLVPKLAIDGHPLEPIFWLTRPAFAGGWSTAWGLPKPTKLAAQMGSIYVFRWDGSEDKLLPVLERLEKDGVGEHCDEGFGECVICHPFHQEVNER